MIFSSVLGIAIFIGLAGGAGAELPDETSVSEAERIEALLEDAFKAIEKVHDYRGVLKKRELFGLADDDAVDIRKGELRIGKTRGHPT